MKEWSIQMLEVHCMNTWILMYNNDLHQLNCMLNILYVSIYHR